MFSELKEGEQINVELDNRRAEQLKRRQKNFSVSVLSKKRVNEYANGENLKQNNIGARSNCQSVQKVSKS